MTKKFNLYILYCIESLIEFLMESFLWRSIYSFYSSVNFNYEPLRSNCDFKYNFLKELSCFSKLVSYGLEGRATRFFIDPVTFRDLDSSEEEWRLTTFIELDIPLLIDRLPYSLLVSRLRSGEPGLLSR